MATKLKPSKQECARQTSSSASRPHDGYQNLTLGGRQVALPLASSTSRSALTGRGGDQQLKSSASNYLSDRASESYRKLPTSSKSSKPSSNFLNLLQKDAVEKDEDSHADASSTTSSTLSLHIASYEDCSASFDRGEEAIKPKGAFGPSLEGIKQRFTEADFHEEAYEFPRQDQDPESSKPESMKFKASQKLAHSSGSKMNPASEKSAAKPSEHGSEKKEKKHHAHPDGPPMPLMMYPMKELVFKGPFTDVVTSPLSISNPTEKTIAFKMMVTAPKHYCCRPNLGYVRPGDTVELQVMVEPMEDEKKIEQEKHKFMIQGLYVNDAPGDANDDEEKEAQKELLPPLEYWAKDHNKKDIMFHKFTVAFHQQTMKKDKLDAILMDLTSRAAAEAAAEMEKERRREEQEKKERERLLKKKILTPEERARLEVLLALQALALAKQKLTGILRIVAPEEVIFRGPFSEYACSAVRLTNPSNKHIYYKVLVTNPKHYIIKPSFGVLKPGETVVSVLIIEHQEAYANIEKEHSLNVENLVLRDRFMVHAAYADNASVSIPEFWKKREQGSVHVHKLRIALHLLNAEESKMERERRTKLKTTGYKHKDLILSGIYGRDSSGLGRETFGGPVLPYPGGTGPNPYNIEPARGGGQIQPVGAAGGSAMGGGADVGRDVNNIQPFKGTGERPVSGYGGVMAGPGGSVRAMDYKGGNQDGQGGQGGANNIGYNPNAMMGPGGARGGSVMMGPGAADGKSGYAAPGNALLYMGGGGGGTGNNYGGGAAGGGGAGNNYGGGGSPGNNYGGGASGAGGAGNNYGGGGAGGTGNNYGADAGGKAGNNYGGGANQAGKSGAGGAEQRPASSYGGGPLGGFGGSMRAMDYGGGGGGNFQGSGGNQAGGAGGNQAGGGAANAGQRNVSSYGGAGLNAPGGSVRAMDFGGGGGGNQYGGGSGGGGNQYGGGSGGGGNQYGGGAGGGNQTGSGSGGGNQAGGGSGNQATGGAGATSGQRNVSAYGPGVAGVGGSVRAMDVGGGGGGQYNAGGGNQYGGGSGGGNQAGGGSGSGNQAGSGAGNQAAGGAGATSGQRNVSSYGPGVAGVGGSVRAMDVAGGASSPGGGNQYGGSSGGGGAGAAGGQSGNTSPGGSNQDNNANNNQTGPSADKNVSVYGGAFQAYGASVRMDAAPKKK